MPGRPRFSLVASIALVAMGALCARGQDLTTPPPSVTPGGPLTLDLSRRDLVNFLTDDKALAPYRSKTGEVAPLRDVFMLGSVKAPWAVIWDPRTCRLLGIFDLAAAEKTPESTQPPVSSANLPGGDSGKEDNSTSAASPFLFKAEGSFPLSKTQGASDQPRYFGFRLVDGVPEFLYHCGRLAIEERIWLDEEGQVLRQRLVLKDPPKNLVFSVPKEWKDRVESSAGSWKGTDLTVPKEQAGEVILTYRLIRKETEPQPSESN